MPNRRILRIKAPKKLIRGKEKSTDSIVYMGRSGTKQILITPKYVLNFGTDDENIGMLKACWESRLETIKAFSVHLSAQNLKKEIRVGPDDLVVLEKWERLFKNLRDVSTLSTTF